MYLFSFFAPQLHVNPNLEIVRIPLFSFEIIEPTGNCGQMTVARFVQVLQSELYFQLPEITFCLHGFLDLGVCNDIVFNFFLCVLILYSFLISAFSLFCVFPLLHFCVLIGLHFCLDYEERKTEHQGNRSPYG